MKRRHLAAWLSLWALGARAQSSGKRRERTSIPDGIRGHTADSDQLLVTPEEQQKFGGGAGFDDPLPLRPRGILPSIEVVQPTPGELKLKAPFRIVLRFYSSDAPIVPGSFKVLYGVLKLDITERIERMAKPSVEGFVLEDAKVPPGRHRLTLQISDEKQRIAEREIRIEVE